MESSRQELYWFNWGAVGVTASILAFAMLSCGGLFNDGFRNFPQCYLAFALPLLALTALSWYLAFGGVIRDRFYRLVYAVLSAWVQVGLVFAAVYAFKLVAPRP